MRALTAANDPDRKLTPTCAGVRLGENGSNGAFLNFFSNRIPGKTDFGGMASESGVWKRYMNAIRQWKKNPICYPRLNVLFVKHDGDSKYPGCKDQRSGSVTAYSDNQIRNKLAENFQCFHHPFRKPGKGSQLMPNSLSLNPFRSNAFQLESMLGQHRFFKYPARAHKQDGIPGIFFQKGFRNGNCREQVPTCAASGHNNPQLSNVSVRSFQGIHNSYVFPDPMFIRIPMDIMLTRSDVPP
jgi:hypothetical protein